MTFSISTLPPLSSQRKPVAATAFLMSKMNCIRKIYSTHICVSSLSAAGLFCLLCSCFDEFFDGPSFPRQFDRHRWGAAHSAMNLAEIVSANEQGNSVTVICKGLGIPQRQPGKPLIEVPDGQVLASNVRRANSVGSGIARFHPDTHPDKRGG